MQKCNLLIKKTLNQFQSFSILNLKIIFLVSFFFFAPNTLFSKEYLNKKNQNFLEISKLEKNEIEEIYKLAKETEIENLSVEENTNKIQKFPIFKLKSSKNKIEYVRYFEYKIRSNDTLGEILFRFNIAPIWGKNNFLEKFIILNSIKIPQDGTTPPTGTAVHVPFPEDGSFDTQIIENYIQNEKMKFAPKTYYRKKDLINSKHLYQFLPNQDLVTSFNELKEFHNITQESSNNLNFSVLQTQTNQITHLNQTFNANQSPNQFATRLSPMKDINNNFEKIKDQIIDRRLSILKIKSQSNKKNFEEKNLAEKLNYSREDQTFLANGNPEKLEDSENASTTLLPPGKITEQTPLTNQQKQEIIYKLYQPPELEEGSENTNIRLGTGQYIWYRVKQKDTIGSILYKLNISPLWGKKGSVKKTVEMNEGKVRKRGNQISIGSWLRLPLQPHWVSPEKIGGRLERPEETLIIEQLDSLANIIKSSQSNSIEIEESISNSSKYFTTRNETPNNSSISNLKKIEIANETHQSNHEVDNSKLIDEQINAIYTSLQKDSTEIYSTQNIKIEKTQPDHQPSLAYNLNTELESELINKTKAKNNFDIKQEIRSPEDEIVTTIAPEKEKDPESESDAKINNNSADISLSSHDPNLFDFRVTTLKPNVEFESINFDQIIEDDSLVKVDLKNKSMDKHEITIDSEHSLRIIWDSDESNSSRSQVVLSVDSPNSNINIVNNSNAVNTNSVIPQNKKNEVVSQTKKEDRSPASIINSDEKQFVSETDTNVDTRESNSSKNSTRLSEKPNELSIDDLHELNIKDIKQVVAVNPDIFEDKNLLEVPPENRKKYTRPNNTNTNTNKTLDKIIKNRDKVISLTSSYSENYSVIPKINSMILPVEEKNIETQSNAEPISSNANSKTTENSLKLNMQDTFKDNTKSECYDRAPANNGLTPEILAKLEEYEKLKRIPQAEMVIETNSFAKGIGAFKAMTEFKVTRLEGTDSIRASKAVLSSDVQANFGLEWQKQLNDNFTFVGKYSGLYLTIKAPAEKTFVPETSFFSSFGTKVIYDTEGRKLHWLAEIGLSEKPFLKSITTSTLNVSTINSTYGTFGARYDLIYYGPLSISAESAMTLYLSGSGNDINLKNGFSGYLLGDQRIVINPHHVIGVHLKGDFGSFQTSTSTQTEMTTSVGAFWIWIP